MGLAVRVPGHEVAHCGGASFRERHIARDETWLGGWELGTQSLLQEFGLYSVKRDLVKACMEEKYEVSSL